MDRVMVCWPTKWTEAAVKAGFATQVADGKWTFQSDAMRDCLAEFAASIRNEALEEAAQYIDDQQYDRATVVYGVNIRITSADF